MMIKQISALMLLSAFLFSCSTSNNVVNNGIFQKRKHNKGWHLKSGSNLKSSHDSAKTEKNSSENDNTSSKEINQNTFTKTAKTIVVSNENIDLALTEEGQVKKNNENSSEKSSSSLPEKSGTSETAEQENSSKKNTDRSKHIEKEEKQSNSQGGGEVSIVLLVILAILLPPVAVYLARGIGTEFWISLILTLLFFLPGIIYALLIVFDVI